MLLSITKMGEIELHLHPLGGFLVTNVNVSQETNKHSSLFQTEEC